MSYTKLHKKQSKERILESASQLFCRFGYERVSIKQVMKLARMTHGAFYAHFDSKEALYKTSLTTMLKRNQCTRLAKSAFSVNHLLQLINNLQSLRSVPLQDRPSPEHILFTDIGHDRPEIRAIYEKSYRNILKLLETRIAALRKLNLLPKVTSPESVKETSRVILSIMVGAVAVAKSIDTEEEQRLILTSAQKHILGLLGDHQFVEEFAAPIV